MSSNYTGNPASAQSPSPSPLAGTGTIVESLPSDGDAASAASIAQALKTLADWGAYSSLSGSPGSPPGARSIEAWDFSQQIANAFGVFEGVKGRWTYTGTGTTGNICTTQVASMTADWGRVVQVGSSSGASDNCALVDVYGWPPLIASHTVYMDWRASIGAVGASNFTAKMGLGVPNAVIGNNRICFRRAPGDTVWVTETDKAGTTTTTTTAVTATASTTALSNRFTILANSSQVLFYIDGNLVATHATNIPIVSLGRIFDIHNSTGAPAGGLLVGPISVGIL